MIRTCLYPGQVALTFDDGPWYWTDRILDELAKHDAKATFFVTGYNKMLGRRIDEEGGSMYAEMLRRMVFEGHQVGSHTWTHQHLANLSSEERFNEVLYNEVALNGIINMFPTYMRPPFAEWRDPGLQRDLGALGYHVVLYNVDTKDYSHNSEAEIETAVRTFDDAVDGRGNGSYVVLCHDIREWTAKVLVPHMLWTLEDRGYRAVTLGECLGDPPENWYRDPSRTRTEAEGEMEMEMEG